MSTAAPPCVVELPPVRLPGTEEHVLATPGGEYRLWLALPSGPPPPAGFPLVLLLDANASFGLATDIARAGALRAGVTGIGSAVVAGIAYPGDAPFHRARRMLDYTPGPPAAEPAPHPTGGRDAFLATLRGPVAARIAERCTINPARRVLVGHSLAGFLALDVLAHDPESFGAYVAISPSVWWNPARLAFTPRARPPRVAIAVGGYEQGLTPWEAGTPEAARTAERRERRAMVDHARDAARRLEAAGYPVQFQCADGETHGSVMPVALGRALRFVLG